MPTPTVVGNASPAAVTPALTESPRHWPFELIDLFVQEVYEMLYPEKSKDLLPFALVSRFFYSATRRCHSRLFDFECLILNITFYGQSSGNKRWLSLYNVLKGNSAFVKDVRLVEVNLSLKKPEDALAEDFASMHSSFSGFMHLLAKAAVHTLILRDDTFTFRDTANLAEDYISLNMAKLPQEVLDSLVALRESPSLESLSLICINNPPPVLVIGNLKTDQIKDLMIIKGHYPLSRVTNLSAQFSDETTKCFIPTSLCPRLEFSLNCPIAPLGRLESLSLRESQVFYDYVETASKALGHICFPFSGLKHLDIGIPSYGSTYQRNGYKNWLWRLLVGTAATLETLAIEVTHPVAFPRPVNLSWLPALQNLHCTINVTDHFKISRYYENESPSTVKPLLPLIQFIKTAGRQNTIESVTVCVAVFESNYRSVFNSLPLLDAVLVSSTFSSLKCVYLRVEIFSLEYWGSPAVAPMADETSEDTAPEDTIPEDTILENAALEDMSLEDTSLEDGVLEDMTLEDAVPEASALEDLALENTTPKDVEDKLRELMPGVSKREGMILRVVIEFHEPLESDSEAEWDSNSDTGM